MALLSSHSNLNPLSLSNPSPSSISSHPSHSQTQPHFPISSTTLKSNHSSCSNNSSQSDSYLPVSIEEAPNQKRRRSLRPRPSFLKLLCEKWPLRNGSLTKEFPGSSEERTWPPRPALGIVEGRRGRGVGGNRICGVSGSGLDADGDQLGILRPGSHVNGSAVCDGRRTGQPHIDSGGNSDQNRFKVEEFTDEGEEIPISGMSQLRVDEMKPSSVMTSGSLRCGSDNGLFSGMKFDGSKPRELQIDSATKLGLEFSVGDTAVSLPATSPTSGQVSSSCDQGDKEIEIDGPMAESPEYNNIDVGGSGNQNVVRVFQMLEEEKGCGMKNAELVEKMVPENELKRLRHISMRMKERIKIGLEGVSEALVFAIHEKWKINEVVKLKFEGIPEANMRRIHELLERRTGGLVIWSSGSTLVLFRGMTYKLDSVQPCNGQSSAIPHSWRLPGCPSGEELANMTEWKTLFHEMAPQFSDSGHEPLPVDADMLPGLVSGYQAPFRLLRYGVRRQLRGKEITFFRRLAITMPPHFILGRNQELEGLAAAMLKLWEKSAITKVAIKQGVSYTSIDRMVEELKKLTGGIILMMNKEYILFHRGNDFLSPDVAEALKERENSACLLHEEETRRDGPKLINSYTKFSKSPLVAGTLAETAAAISHWGEQPTSEDVEKMIKDRAASRRASFVKYLENKLALGKGKLTETEKALAQIQEYLEPTELPSDLEVITDEERFLLRKMGLSMKPFLLLGNRGVFGGTVQNMHLHWKFRELVKIIVKRKNIAQVKHIAISLEAESGGVLVSIEKLKEGYAIIIYRGKNYQRPLSVTPKNLLTKRQALARSIELQRHEALKHHVADLQRKIDMLSSEMADAQTA